MHATKTDMKLRRTKEYYKNNKKEVPKRGARLELVTS